MGEFRILSWWLIGRGGRIRIGLVRSPAWMKGRQVYKFDDIYRVVVKKSIVP